MENKWYVGNNSNDSQGLIIDENTGRNVAVSYDAKDAALIAAAPELLAALLYIVNDCEPGEDAQLTVTGYNLACAVIAKAKGE